jgi:hypothetical protein
MQKDAQLGQTQQRIAVAAVGGQAIQMCGTLVSATALSLIRDGRQGSGIGDVAADRFPEAEQIRPGGPGEGGYRMNRS